MKQLMVSFQGFVFFFHSLPQCFFHCCRMSSHWGAELGRAAGSSFGIHLLIWKRFILEASLVNFEFWMYFWIKFLCPDAAMEKLCYVNRYMGNCRKHHILCPQISILNLVIKIMLPVRPAPSRYSF